MLRTGHLAVNGATAAAVSPLGNAHICIEQKHYASRATTAKGFNNHLQLLPLLSNVANEAQNCQRWSVLQD